MMTASASAQDSVPGDPYVWLEDIDSPRAVEWVKAENQRTLGIFQADRRYQTFYTRALEVLEAKDRIPTSRSAPASSTISGRTPTM